MEKSREKEREREKESMVVPATRTTDLPTSPNETTWPLRQSISESS